MKKYRIADVTIEIEYADKLILDTFKDFECDTEAKSDIFWNLKEGVKADFPKELTWNDMGGFSIARDNNKVYVLYHIVTYYMIDAIIYENEYQTATIYMSHNIDYSDAVYVDKLTRALTAFEREMFFLALQKHGGISIHSASIIYRQRGIVFSALSGTGKSTHTNLWNEIYDTPILDGDVTVCRIVDDIPYIYGLPWMGSSELYMNERVQLEAIVFIQQAELNHAEAINSKTLIQRLFARSFISRWDADITHMELDNAIAIASKGVKGYILECNISREAVDEIKNLIDSKWSE